MNPKQISQSIKYIQGKSMGMGMVHQCAYQLKETKKDWDLEHLLEKSFWDQLHKEMVIIQPTTWEKKIHTNQVVTRVTHNGNLKEISVAVARKAVGHKVRER